VHQSLWKTVSRSEFLGSILWYWKSKKDLLKKSLADDFMKLLQQTGANSASPNHLEQMKLFKWGTTVEPKFKQPIS